MVTFLVAGLVPAGRAADVKTARPFDIPAGDATATLKQFSAQSGIDLVFSLDEIKGEKTNAVRGEMLPTAALDAMLVGTALSATQDKTTGAFAVGKAVNDPNAPRAALASSSARPQTNPAVSGATDATESVIQLEKFVTTGSRFNERLDTASPVPVDVIVARDLRTGGYTETAQMLVAAVPSFNFPRTSSNDGLDIVRPATLRGLSPDQTLVLVNGKRRHTSSVVNVNNAIGRGSVAVDINAIPAVAIGRVEVLRDGAAAQYGSDAIAGVINLVLDKSLGQGFDATYGVTGEGDGQVWEGNAYAGVPLGEKGVLRASFNYRDRERTDRSAPDTRQQYFGRDPVTGALTNISGNFGSGTGLTPSNGTLDPREATVNRRSVRRGDPAVRDWGLFLNAEQPLAGSAAIYGFGGYTERTGVSTGFFRRAGQNETVRAIHPNGFLPQEKITSNDFSLTGGVKGAAGGWSWDLSTGYGRNQMDLVVENSNNVSLGASSPTRFNVGGHRFGQWTTNLDATREIDIGGPHPLQLAFGAEYRRDNYELVAGEPDSHRNGGVPVLDGPNAGQQSPVGASIFPGFRPTDAADVSRSSRAIYLEAAHEFNDRVHLGAAVRYEDYSDFGENTSFKLTGRLRMTEALALRASYNTGFRAPHLGQSFISTTATFFVNAVPVDNRLFPVNDPAARLLGARSLQPEESEAVSAGLVFERGAFSASADAYRIVIEDRIALSSNFGGLTTFLTANGFPGVGSASYFTNAVDTRTTGLDLTARYRLKLAELGRLTVTFAAGFVDTEHTRIAPTPSQLVVQGTTTPLYDLTQQIRQESSQPKDKQVLGLNWEWKKLAVNLRNVRYGEYETVAFTSLSQARIDALSPGFKVRLAPTVPASSNFQVIQIFDAEVVTDLDLTWNLSPKIGFSAGANNLFDLAPGRNLASTVASVAAGTNGSDNGGTFPFTNITPFGTAGVFYYGKISYKF